MRKRVKFKLKILLQSSGGFLARIICGTVFSRFALNIGRNFTLRCDLRRRFCARLKFTRTLPRRFARARSTALLASHAATQSKKADISQRFCP